MPRCIKLALLFLSIIPLLAQAQKNPFYVPKNLPNRDSLKAIILNPKDSLQKLAALRELGHAYYENKRDSANFYFEQNIALARSINSKLWEADACNTIGFISYVQGNYPRALHFLTQAIKLAENPNIEKGEWKLNAPEFISPRNARLSVLARSYQHLASLYGFAGNFKENADMQLRLFRKALDISTSLGDTTMMGIINMNISRHYTFGTNWDSILFYHERALQWMNKTGYKRYIGNGMYNLGEAYRRAQQPHKAKIYYWYGMQVGEDAENTRTVADNALALANTLQSLGNTDSAIVYAYIAANRYKSTLILNGLSESYAALSAAFSSQNKIDSAFHYQGLSLATRKELDADDKARRFQQINFDEQMKVQEAAENERKARNRIITLILLGGLAILASIGIFLYRNNIARKKANKTLEEKNRDLQIEAALERTRNQSMLMQHSDEIKNISAVFHQQLLQLNIPSEFSYVWLPNQEKDDHQFWASWEENEEGAKIYKSKHVTYPLDKSEPYTAACFAAWASPERTHIEYIPPADVPAFFDTWKELLEGAKDLKAEFFQGGIYYAEAYMRYGCFGINIRRELSTAEKEVLKRFSTEFERAYTRFLDLQKAEENARESQIEAAMERIRARAMAMHSSGELLEVANVLREQMGLLNQPDLETSAVLIYHSDLESWDSWHAFRPTRDTMGTIRNGTATFSKDDCGFTRDIVHHFLSPETEYTLELSGAAREEWLGILMRAAPEIAENAISDEIVHFDTTYFHFSDFTGGSLLTVSYLPPSAEIRSLQQRAAKVFDLAYRRYRDLQKAEAQALQAEQDLIAIKEAKLKAEQALTDLQSAQKQLIQAEKMASLGELTAGIAHEIQNPLNFVNNFSEVNTEIISEVREAISSGNLVDAEEMLGTIADNEQKINEHGKRADAIVKGMLQHSRTGSGIKEPTNINALADEYLRLAYHGLKAKDKSFNANLKTDFDQSIGNIDIIPQDIGRVLLNLINNAFYAVHEKKKQMGDGYEPEVTVSTRLNGSDNSPIRQSANPPIIIVSVADNGNGIPETIRNKIFQPFFTTKPTGQGTGLGLSLSYDIIKAHGGEIRVESKEGGGSTFTIVIPE